MPRTQLSNYFQFLKKIESDLNNIFIRILLEREMNFNNEQFKLGRLCERLSNQEFSYELLEQIEFINDNAKQLNIELKNEYIENLIDTFDIFDERIYNDKIYYLVPEMDKDSIATRNFDGNKIEYIIYIEDKKIKIISGNQKDELIKIMQCDQCDCCLKSWNNNANEWGICECICSRCGIELNICRYDCVDKMKIEPTQHYLHEMRELQRIYEDGEIKFNHVETLIKLIEIMNEFGNWNINSYDEEIKDFINRILMIVKFGEERFAMLRSDRVRITKNLNSNEWVNLYKIQDDSTPRNITMTNSDINKPCGIFNMTNKKVKIFV